MNSRTKAAWHTLAIGALVFGVSSPRQTAGASEAPAPHKNLPAVRTISDAKLVTDLQHAGTTYSNCVVTVDVYRDSDGDQVHRRGAGVVATKSGFIFTPAFLVEGADFVIVSFPGEKRSPARVLARDSGTQLAILKAGFLPDGLAVPGMCEGESEKSDAPVALINLSPEGRKTLLGQVVALRDEVGPLKGVLEVTVNGVPHPLGGLVLNSRGEMVGLALATMVDKEEAQPKSAKVFVLPASRIREAIDRIMKQEDGTEMETERTLSVA